MTIRLRTTWAGPSGIWQPGKRLLVGRDITAQQAKDLLEGRFASEMSETADAAPAETAMQARGGKQGKGR